jgi:hypothetical protein
MLALTHAWLAGVHRRDFEMWTPERHVGAPDKGKVRRQTRMGEPDAGAGQANGAAMPSAVGHAFRRSTKPTAARRAGCWVLGDG